jgi:hypothetical protein
LIKLTLLLATLTGLVFLALLAGLIALLPGLSRLSALLAVPFHIICHDSILLFACPTGRTRRFNFCINLVAVSAKGVWMKGRKRVRTSSCRPTPFPK